MEPESNCSKEDMLLSALSGSSPGNANPHMSSSVPTTLNNNSNAGFTLLSPSSANAVVDSDGGHKKKRGRPRKYDADGNLRISYASPSVVSPPPPGFGLSPPQTASFGLSSQVVMKATSSGFGEIFADCAVGDFTPHVVTVRRGEDVAGKILLLGQQGYKGICVLSAIGVVSNVTIRQPSSSGGILTYEGRFEILSLTGSYTVASSTKGWVGALSVSLAGPDGRVVGGGVAGSMTAASPTQLVLGSFTPGGYKRQKRKYVRQQLKASPSAMNVAAPKPISQEDAAFQRSQSSSPSLEEDDVDDSMVQQAASHGIWNFGPSPDINLSIHGRVTP